MIDAIRVAYAALISSPGREGRDLRVSEIEDVGPRVQLGLDADGRQHLLVESPDAPDTDSGIVAVTTSHRDLMIGGTTHRYLDVTCEQRELSEVFDHFAAAVVERVRGDEADLGAVVDEVLALWRSFFLATGAPPSRETLTGVVGELLVLRDIAARKGPDPVASWVGPRGGRHDYRRDDAALEVKTTRAHTSRVVSIHGEDQLLEPEGASLFLHFVRLEEVAGVGLGVSLGGLLDEICSFGVPRLTALQAVADAGVPSAALGTVGDIRFEVRERLTFPVDGSTPRIVPSTFAGGERPTGIVDLTYRLDLDHIAERALNGPAYDAVMDRLAGEHKA